jgi:hypothetical protein
MAVIEIREDAAGAPAAVIAPGVSGGRPAEWNPVSNPTEMILGQVNTWA